MDEKRVLSRSPSCGGGDTPFRRTPPTRHLPLGHTITVAVDRDAQHTLELTLVPQGHHQKSTSWLLQHGIPASASLPSALQRLRAASDEITSTPAAAPQETAEAPTCASAPSSPVHVPVSSSTLVSAPISAVLVGYVVSEVHAYCLLIHCQSPAVAAQIRKRLEKEAAPGTAAPVDFVEPEGTVCSRELQSVASTAPSSTPSAHGTSAGQPSTTTTTQGPLPLEQIIFSCCIAVHDEPFPRAPAMSPVPRRAGSSPALSPKLPHTAFNVLRTTSARSGADPSSPRAAAASSTATARSPLLLPFSQAIPPALGEDCSICQTDALYTRPVVVTLCHHAFHMDCYSKLVDGASDCPLCRFSLSELQNDARCDVCGTFEDLWVCLVCGFTGCGRARLHHQQHSSAIGHSCAWQASTGRIWDAAAGLFLHQEVAIQLGEDDESAAAKAATAKRQATWWADEDDDEDLRAAMSESKQNAVGQFYVDVLQRLLAEQAAWVNSGCPGLDSAAPPSTLSDETDHRAVPAEPAAALAALESEEAECRGAIVGLYIGETQSLCAQQSILLTLLIKRTMRRQRQVQELIMLQCHQNAGLKQRSVRVDAQVAKLRSHGKAEAAAKGKTLEELEARATQLLTNLS